MGGASSSTLAGLPRVEEHPPVATPAKVKATAPRSFTEIARSEEALAAQAKCRLNSENIAVCKLWEKWNRLPCCGSCGGYCTATGWFGYCTATGWFQEAAPA